ncbi:MAG: S8 family serine peptidase, partial [Ilumatobacteraceae bacterium]|nr:S8 family serine peptidase [Ilumatobacteraceae bacterium]
MIRKLVAACAILLTVALQPVITQASISSDQSQSQSGRYIVRLADEINPTNFLATRGSSISDRVIYTEAINGFVGTMTSSQATSLRSTRDVISVEPDYQIQTSATQTVGVPGVLDGKVPWGLDRIDQRATIGDNSYTYGTDGTGVTAYVIDTGIRATHEQFGSPSRVVGGWSWMANASNIPVTACTPAPDASLSVPAGTFDVYTEGDVGLTDNHGHGTHIAGTIGGTATGVAKGATMVAVRALNSCGLATAAIILQAIEWVIANHVSGPAVANMSFGVTTENRMTTLEVAVLNMITDGITVVAAAGNGDKNGVALDACNVLPASVAGVISVAASDQDDKEASFSNYGTCVDIFAPGVLVLSADHRGNDRYAQRNGTSMAAPHVVGVVARYLQGNPTATPMQVWDWMSANATYCSVTSYSQTRLNNSLSRLIQMDAAPGLPCEPQNVTLSVEGVAATFNWTQPPGSNGSSLIESSVTLSGEIPKCVTTLTTCTFSGLAKGFEYSAVLVSKNSIGESKKITLKFTPPGISAPTAPQTVAAVATKKSATVSWTAPLSVNGSPITAYTVTLTPGGATCSTLELSCVFTGLLAGTTYTASVTATNAAGVGVIATATVIPTAQPAAITKIRTVLGNQSVEIALVEGNTSETVYTASTQGGKSCVLDTILMSCKIKGLKNGKSYV